MPQPALHARAAQCQDDHVKMIRSSFLAARTMAIEPACAAADAPQGIRCGGRYRR
jgi:hypothetical protein